MGLFMERLRVVAVLCIVMSMFLTNEVEGQECVSVRSRLAGVASALYRGAQRLFPISAPPERRSFSSEMFSRLMVGLVYEYVFNPREVDHKSVISRILPSPALERVLTWCSVFYSILALRDESAYFSYYGEDGKLRRCYAANDPIMFRNMLARPRLLAELTNMVHRERPANDLPAGKVPLVDGRVFIRNILVELAAIGLNMLVTRYIDKNLNVKIAKGSSFVCRVASRMAEFIVYSGIKEAVVRPIINFADRAQRMGFRAAWKARWYQPFYSEC
jgi:hypothetical protein